MSEWDETVKEWLTDSGKCFAAGFANADGRMYAAYSTEGSGWEVMWNEDEEKPIAQEDGTDVMEVVNEAETIQAAIETGRTPKGLYVGGKKYRIVRLEKEFDYNDQTYVLLTCGCPGGGLVLAKTTNGTIVLGNSMKSLISVYYQIIF
eukprot:GHVH01007701.1.p1 GENE.GHVH01007701.1~~GHVH01007701.1.p1  ORF type:complete len:148 (-),score=21.81 GHVH01007701.1:55-498(-)